MSGRTVVGPVGQGVDALLLLNTSFKCRYSTGLWVNLEGSGDSDWKGGLEKRPVAWQIGPVAVIQSMWGLWQFNQRKPRPTGNSGESIKCQNILVILYLETKRRSS